MEAEPTGCGPALGSSLRGINYPYGEGLGYLEAAHDARDKAMILEEEPLVTPDSLHSCWCRRSLLSLLLVQEEPLVTPDPPHSCLLQEDWWILSVRP